MEPGKLPADKLLSNRQKKNFRVWTFQTLFRPKDSQLLANSLISGLAIVGAHPEKKSEWTWKKLWT